MRIRRRTVLIVVILILLAVPAYFGFQVFTTAPGHQLPPPRWTIQRDDLTVSSCDAALMQASTPPAQPVVEAKVFNLSPLRAGLFADEVLGRYLQVGQTLTPREVSAPKLLTATLADGRQHSVWARLWALSDVTYDHNSAVLYIDADTGEPLALYSGITLINPLSAGCTAYSTDPSYQVSAKTLIPVMLTGEGIVIAALAVAGGVLWLVTRIRR